MNMGKLEPSSTCVSFIWYEIHFEVASIYIHLCFTMNMIPPLTDIGCKQFISLTIQQSTLGIVEFYDQQSNSACLLYLCESCLCVGLTGEVDKGDIMT